MHDKRPGEPFLLLKLKLKMQFSVLRWTLSLRGHSHCPFPTEYSVRTPQSMVSTFRAIDGYERLQDGYNKLICKVHSQFFPQTFRSWLPCGYASWGLASCDAQTLCLSVVE